MKRSALIVALLLGANVAVHAAQPDEYIAAYVKQHDFNGSILIQKQARRVFAASYGLANIPFQVPNRAGTRYKVASITKLFTAVLILQLREQGRIGLDQPIKTYLPDYLGQGADKVSIHQLLNHTSGLPNFDRVADAATALRDGLPTYQTPYTSDQLVAKFCSGDLVHAPGTVFDYNNGDYILLGKIIEHLYGASYERVVQQRILDPLRMKGSGLLHQSDVIAGLADTYFYRDDLKALSPDLPVYPENWYAAGALYSTTDDLLAFADALFGLKLINQTSLDLLTKPGLDDYGYGVWSYETTMNGRKHRVVKRPGRIMGAQAQLFHVFDPEVTIILLANTATSDLDQFVAEIAKRTVD